MIARCTWPDVSGPKIGAGRGRSRRKWANFALSAADTISEKNVCELSNRPRPVRFRGGGTNP